mmetsp:Transcript_4068/g.6899  ORF Transcript_4068/g.6899 Transcript_4068/m.6899 type:complete len:342 (-) Transcript_4068:1136-2161(-)
MAFQVGMESRAVNIVQDLLEYMDQNHSKYEISTSTSGQRGDFPPSSTRVTESAIINARIDAVWNAIKSATFDFLSTVKSSQIVPPNSSSIAVGNCRRIVYNDGASQTIQISSISLLSHSITYSVISSSPSIAYSGAEHKIRAIEVTTDDRTYIEWSTDFSNDASLQVIEDSRYKKKEAFGDLREYLSIDVVADHDEDDEKSHDMLSVNVQRTTDIAIDTIWKIVSNFGDVSFSSLVEKCSLTEGGKVRQIVVKNNGGEYAERLIVVDAKQYTMRYAMIRNTALPVSNCSTTVKLVKHGKRGCVIHWSSRFKAHEVGDSLAKRTMQEVLGQGVDELLRFAKK